MNSPSTVTSLQPYSLLRPDKIRWISSLTSQQTVLESLNSKSLRKFLSRSAEVCAEQGIRKELFVMTAERYAQWHALYTEEMLALRHDVIAQSDWFENKATGNQEIHGIFYYQNNALIGGSVITVSKDMVNLAFKANRRLEISNDKDASLGAVIEYDFLCFAQPYGTVISSGRARNSFGVHSSLGYLAFKLRFGYQAVWAENAESLTDVPVNAAGKVLCFAVSTDASHLDQTQLRPYYLTPTPEDISELIEVQRKLPGVTTLKA
jgi:hypothetical protein